MIEVNELHYRYPAADREAVGGLQFHVPAGEVLGFLGPSGAGKSTTQKILIGLLKGYQGSVRLMDRDLSAWGTDLYEHVGVSFERPNHFLKLSGLENLQYFQSLYRGPTCDPIELLRQVGLEQDALQRVGAYSKGMQNRLTVARALLSKPKMLFLDEPTAGLDPVSSRRIKDLIRQRQADGATVFLTTHDMHVAEELCDRVVFLVDGRIALIDSPRALKLKHGRRLVQVRCGEDLLIEEFPLEGVAENQRFLELLRRDDLQTIHTQETTLEEIFIRVTGRQLASS